MEVVIKKKKKAANEAIALRKTVKQNWDKLGKMVIYEKNLKIVCFFEIVAFFFFNISMSIFCRVYALCYEHTVYTYIVHNIQHLLRLPAQNAKSVN